MNSDTPVCQSEYVPWSGRQRREDLIRCTLPVHTFGEHKHLPTGMTWAGRSERFAVDPAVCDHPAHRDAAELGDVDRRLMCMYCGTETFVPWSGAQSVPSDSQAGRTGTDEDAYEVASAAHYADIIEPPYVGLGVSRAVLAREPRFRAAVDAALKHDRARLAELLRLAASGRRRYARTPHSHAEHLEHEAVLLDLAADVVAGDLTPMQSWLPSWMWTDEIREAGRG